MERRDQRSRDLTPDEFCEKPAALLLGQPAERHPLDVRYAPQVGQQVCECTVSLGVDVAIAHEDQERAARRIADDVPEQEQRRLGRPVQVVEDEKRRLSGCDARQQHRDGLEEPATLGLGVAGDHGRRLRQPRR